MPAGVHDPYLSEVDDPVIGKSSGYTAGYASECTQLYSFLDVFRASGFSPVSPYIISVRSWPASRESVWQITIKKIKIPKSKIGHGSTVLNPIISRTTVADVFKLLFWVFFGSKVGPVSRNPNLRYDGTFLTLDAPRTANCPYKYSKISNYKVFAPSICS